MSAYTDAVRDFEADNATMMMTHADYVEHAKIQAARLLEIYKQAHDDVRPINDAAKALGCKPHQLKHLVNKGAVWSCRVKVRSKRNGRYYSVYAVDVDECRKVRAAEAAVVRKPKPPRVFEQPPAGLVTLGTIAREMAVYENTLAKWARSGQLAAEKYVAIAPSGHYVRQWHARRDEVIALFRAKRAGRFGKSLRRVRTVPVTPLIRELWGMEDEEE